VIIISLDNALMEFVQAGKSLCLNNRNYQCLSIYNGPEIYSECPGFGSSCSMYCQSSRMKDVECVMMNSFYIGKTFFLTKMELLADMRGFVKKDRANNQSVIFFLSEGSQIIG